jgi:hypothetical protein
MRAPLLRLSILWARPGWPLVLHARWALWALPLVLLAVHRALTDLHLYAYLRAHATLLRVVVGHTPRLCATHGSHGEEQCDSE